MNCGYIIKFVIITQFIIIVIIIHAINSIVHCKYARDPSHKWPAVEVAEKKKSKKIINKLNSEKTELLQENRDISKDNRKLNKENSILKTKLKNNDIFGV